MLPPAISASAAAAAIEVFGSTQRTLESLAQTKTPQGVVAVVPFLDRSAGELAAARPAAGPALVLVLHDLADPGNAGTLVRSAEAFGVAAVCFGPHAVEPYNDKVVRASMGSLFRVPIVRYDEWPHFRAAAAQRSSSWSQLTRAARTCALSHCRAASRYWSVTSGTACATCRRRICMPRSACRNTAAVDSLNAAVAGSILLYEFARAHGSKT